MDNFAVVLLDSLVGFFCCWGGVGCFLSSCSSGSGTGGSLWSASELPLLVLGLSSSERCLSLDMFSPLGSKRQQVLNLGSDWNASPTHPRVRSHIYQWLTDCMDFFISKHEPATADIYKLPSLHEQPVRLFYNATILHDFGQLQGNLCKCIWNWDGVALS